MIDAVLNLGQFAVLTGIFWKMGAFGAILDALEKRIENLEGK